MHHFETESDSYQERDESETKTFSKDEYSDTEVHSAHSIPKSPKAAFIVYWMDVFTCPTEQMSTLNMFATSCVKARK